MNWGEISAKFDRIRAGDTDFLKKIRGLRRRLTLLLAATDQRMIELKLEPLLSVPANADDKEVFELFDKYNLRMLTVIDEENRPIGAITVDDVVSKLLK